MIITTLNPDTVSIKTKNETITLGSEVKIGHFTVEGAGEYDVATIQCEVHTLPVGLVYFIRSEDLNITFLSQIDAEVTKLDDASNTNILVIDIREGDAADALKPILKSLEPAYVFLLGSGATSEFKEGLGLPTQPTQNLKLSRSSLPQEGTTLIISE